MWKEFSKFILRGNVIDLAVGIIIGASFTAIVNSLVNDLLMPVIGVLIGGIDFSDIVITLKAAVGEQPAVTVNIGLFINAVIQFLIIGFAVFLLVRSVNNLMERFQKKEESATPAPAPAPTTEQELLVAIRELTAAIRNQK